MILQVNDVAAVSALPDAPHAAAVAAVLAGLDVDAGRGLAADSVAARRQTFGPNWIASRSARSGWTILKEQLDSVVILTLIGAAALSFAFEEWIDGLAMTLVPAINTAIGFVSEARAVRSM